MGIPRGAPQAVPATNSAGNDNFRDVIGSKLDRSYNGGDSLSAQIHTLSDHAHKASQVLPDRAAAIAVTAGTGWAYGAPVSLGSVVGDPFDIHWIDAIADTNAEYQIAVVVDSVVVGETAFTRGGVQTANAQLTFTMPVTPADEVFVKIAPSSNGAGMDIKLIFHQY